MGMKFQAIKWSNSRWEDSQIHRRSNGQTHLSLRFSTKKARTKSRATVATSWLLLLSQARWSICALSSPHKAEKAIQRVLSTRTLQFRQRQSRAGRFRWAVICSSSYRATSKFWIWTGLLHLVQWFLAFQTRLLVLLSRLMKMVMLLKSREVLTQKRQLEASSAFSCKEF